MLLELAGRLGAARGNPVAVLLAEAARVVLGERVAVALAVGRAHEGGHDLEIPVADVRGFAPEVGKPEVDVELQQVDPSWALGHDAKVAGGSDGIGCRSWQSCVLVRRVCPPGGAPRRRSASSRSGISPPARSTSKAGSGWT